MEDKKSNRGFFPIKKISFLLLSLFFLIEIQGCASSQVSRNAAASIDNAYLGVTGARGELTLEQTYQNSSQRTKGVLIGGVAGGILGSVTNGVGTFAGAATGAILGGALGAYIDAHTTLIDKLENRGVKILVLGDQVLIVIPSYTLFYESSPNLRESSFTTLDLVSQLIGNYVNMSVQVAAYSNASGTPNVDLALTQSQAEHVARYLWKHCVNTRLLYAVGRGCMRLVTANNGCDGYNENSRIEITFEKLPV